MSCLSRGVALLLLLAASEPQVRAVSALCHRVSLNPRPGQVSAQVWSLDGRELVLTDVSTHQLLRYAPDGSLLGSVDKPPFVKGDFKPIQVHAMPEGFLVCNSAYEWIWLDRGFKPLRSVAQGLPPKFALISEALVEHDELAGFGTFRKEDGSWSFGFLQVKLSPAPKVLKVVQEIPYESKGGNLSSILGPLVAKAGEISYGLQLGEPSFILNLRNGQRLKAFPPGFERLPVLPKNEGEISAAGRVRVVDASTIPVALYGRGAFLYLLTREQQASKKPLWRLHRIDPKKDALLGSVILPTSAMYLELAPGPSVWAVLEESRGATSMLKSDALLHIAASAIDGGGQIPPCE
ncbi:MAG: hypothetical protein ABIS20_00875 [Thermoanaerobaculia bacterium]